MRKLFIFFLLINVVVGTNAQTTAEKLARYFEAAEKAGTFNGSVLIAKNGTVLLNKGYGFKNKEAKTLNDSNTIYQIGSVTKQFTSTVILKLFEEGKLQLSDKLEKYFPQLTYAGNVTIEQLLTHTSGIPNYTNDTAFMAHKSDKATNRDSMFQLFNKPLDFEPGSKFNYSNSGYSLLGYIIEQVTGKPYETVVHKLVFAPLQMHNSGFDFANLVSDDKATGYYVLTNELSRKAKFVDSTVSFAAGAIYSTTGDLLKWDDAIIHNPLISANALENAFTPRFSKYGFGFAIDTVNGKRRISHNGGIDGFLSVNTIIPSEDTKIIVLSNNMSTRLNEITTAINNILDDKEVKLPHERSAITIDEEGLKQYVGDYEIAPGFSISIRLKGKQLFAQASGQSEAPIFPEKEDYFFYKVVDAQIEFIKNDKGEIEKMILHQNGKNIPGKKTR